MRRTWLPLLALLIFCACAEDHEPSEDREPSRPDPRQTEQHGEALYRRYCSLCHGRDGEGYAADNAPALHSPEWLRTASDAFITTAISEGRPGTPMSAWSRRFGGPLNEAQIDAIRTYLRSWQRHPQANVDDVAVSGDPTRGRAVYLVKCAECHGVRGEGVDAIALANPGLLASASNGFLQYAVAHGRTGTRMEPFREELTQEQIDDVVMYVRSFARGGAQAHAHDAPSQDVALEDVPTLDELQLVVNPEGRTPRFHLREERFVPAAEVKAALDRGQRMVLLDARATSDWLHSRIPGALPVPFYELDDIVEALPRDGTWMIAYCACPHAASGRVVDALRARGFTNTAVLDEGITHWEQQGFPTASGPQQP